MTEIFTQAAAGGARTRTAQGATLSRNWHNSAQVFAKRGLDVVGSLLLVVILSPLMIFLAIAVKLTSSGPMLYRWNVVGKNGVPFIGYKFRSMVLNADVLRAKLQAHNEMKGPVFKLTDDPRVTRFGRWMRKHSLDELPQLFSVLRGDMSLVGPRPPLVVEYAAFSQYQKQKLMVKPGITCLWQVRGRNEIADLDEWVALDLEYIRTWSLALDCKIILETTAEVFRGSGK